MIGVGGLVSRIPQASESVALDIDINIQSWSIDHGDDNADVVGITAQLTNNEDVSVQPVAMPWGHGSNPQILWPIVSGPESLSPAQSALYEFDGSDSPLQANDTAVLIIYDQGTEQRAYERFVPTETPTS